MDDRLKVTFLGTGTSQGIPVIGSQHPVCLSSDPKDKRLRVSVLLQFNGCHYVIDCGPDFRQQMLANPVDRLDGILFTHEHADHTAGIDDIRPFFFRQGDIPIYVSERTMASLRVRFDYIFADTNRYPGAPAVQVNLITKDKPFELAGEKVWPIEAWHNRLPVFGYRIKDFAYLTDVKRVEDTEMPKLKNLKVLVVNALREEPHHSHFNLAEALAFANEVGAERTYFTHISHLLGFHADVQARLPKNVFLAYDNLTIMV
ncbi:beta-lactamase [Flagellimonas lutaonensis]|uniref:Beta-lactamase n=1 Tax=Flagellimonas lutaonensis TaxID=516051 RepID=A0A0D5YVG9_9FLAO|nr:MBL fold metallo-hydrolase [Allomuricauda lutaonensis]AKA36230.1 beta-lactamase [Allomuricauda lutaonensis]